MMVKTLEPLRGSKTALLDRIRSTKSRRLNLRSFSVNNVEGRSTVLEVSSGNRLFGTVRAKTSREANRIRQSESVSLTIGYTPVNTKIIQANFE